MRKKVNQDGFQKCSHEPGGEGEGAGGEGEEVEGREGAQRTGQPGKTTLFDMRILYLLGCCGGMQLSIA